MNRRRDILVACGLALALAALYALSGPGRLDIIDGQVRFEVARNLVSVGKPVIRDPFLDGIRGVGDERYAGYGPAASYVGAPLVGLGAVVGDRYGETSRFLYSFTSAGFGGLLAAVFFIMLRRLGLARRRAVVWTLVAALATLVWPLATSSFDQVQHAFLVLLAVLLADWSRERESTALAAMAGVAAGLLLLYQDAFVILLPALGLATLSWSRLEAGWRRLGGWGRFLLFHVGTGVGFALWVEYNLLRFGKMFMTGKFIEGGHPPPWGDTWIGLAGLFASPGKSILLFSPPVLLAAVGFRALWRRRPTLAISIAAASAVWVLLIASLSFYGGDWGWGPRYLVVVLPLWALAFPFANRRWLAAPLIAAGLAVQVMALSVDHQRFFFDRRLPAFFWATDPLYYFEESQLLSRPGEILSVARPGVPPTAQRFAPTPQRQSLTYCIFGSRDLWLDPLWVERYQIFFLPRPWPLWMPWVEERREVLIPYRPAFGVLLAVAALGALAVSGGLRRDRPQPP